MYITNCTGSWMEKSIKTSPEDSFIHSVVTYSDGGKEKQFHLVYIGYFEKEIIENLPYDGDSIFNISGKEVNLRDVTGLIALIQFPEYRNKKRVYYHEQEQFSKIFTNVNFDKIEEVITKLLTDGHFNLDNSIPFLNETSVS